MTPSPDDELERARVAIRGEILRWNPVMNLVSRQDTAQQLDRLLEQCAAGFGVVLKPLAALGVPLETAGYVDIGSGNGLPGLLWAAGISGRGGRGPVWLVEPRKRRAWFLARAARQAGCPRVAVLAGRWGDTLPGSSTPDDLLVSIKALRLTEPEVLDGIERGFTGARGSLATPQRIVIARFLGPDPGHDAGAARELHITGAGGASGWRQTDCRTMAGPGVRLLTTAYART